MINKKEIISLHGFAKKNEDKNSHKPLKLLALSYV
jgi:hypothetical protein